MTTATAAAVLDQDRAEATEGFRQVSLDLIIESPFNPRKYFDKAKLAELTESIRNHGIITPALARLRPDGTYELAAGHRRFRAAKVAGLTTMPVVLRQLSDLALLEILNIENLQREDVTALEEASGYHMLLNFPLGTYTVESLAAKVGKSKEYLYGRLNLLKLAPEVKKALETERITPSHAALLVPLNAEAQKEVLRESLNHTAREETPSVRELNHTIEQTVRKQKREASIEAALTKAAKDHPEAKKIYKLLEYSYASEPGTLNGREWKAVPKETDGALVGLLLRTVHDHTTTKPKVVYFERVKERRPSFRATEHGYLEREKRQRERERVRAAGEVAIRRAFAAAAGKIDVQPFLAAVVDHLILTHYHERPGVALAFNELVGVPASANGGGMGFRLDPPRLRGAIQKLGPEQLRAAALYLLAQPYKGGTYDNSEAYARTAQLAKLLKIDMEAIGKEAGKVAEAAHQAKLQTSATAKLRKSPKPKARTRAKGKV